MRNLARGLATGAALLFVHAADAGPYPQQTQDPGARLQTATAQPRAQLAQTEPATDADADASAPDRDSDSGIPPSRDSGAAEASPPIEYVVEITGVEGELKEFLDKVSTLKSKIDTPPASRAALLRRVKADMEAFEAALKARGYYAYQLKEKVDFAVEPPKAVIDVFPGEIYTLATFDIVYTAPEDEGLIRDPAKLGVTIDDAALAKTVAEAPAILLRRLGEAGYPLAKMSKRSAVVDHDAKEMRVSLQIDQGPRVAFGPTIFTGLDRVDPEYAIRVANLPKGAEFDVSKVDGARRRLFSTGLFDGLQVRLGDTPDATGSLPVTFEVKEKDRRTISVGLNYSTTEGAGADVEWTHRNLFGEDEDLTITFRVAELEQSARTELAAPNFLTLDQRVFVAAELAREDTDAFEERHLQFEIGGSRKLGERWRTGIAGEIGIAETIENGISENNIIASLPMFAAYDGADDPFDPSKGYKVRFDIEPTAITLENTDVFTLFSASGSAYQSLTEDKTLIAAIRAKAATIVGADRDIIPAGRRLYAGGGGSIRGFEFQSVSPLDAAGDPDGGKSLVEFGVETRWRITDDIGIVPFLDGGGAFAGSIPDLDELRFAAGLGLRYYTPIGPLRFDIATPLDRKSGENLIEFYISLGQAF